MDETTRLLLVYAAIPGVIGIISYMMKSILNRLDQIEKTLPNKLEEPEVRQLLSDKIDPLSNDIQRFEVKLDKIMDILIQGK